MSSLVYELRRRNVIRHLRLWLSVLVVAAGVGVAVWSIVDGINSYDRGNYAGIHFGHARSSALDALAVNYGLDFVSTMRFAKPNVVNTHTSNALIDGEVRSFHLVGARGVRWCVWVWDGRDNWTGSDGTGVNIGALYKIIKNCNFQTNKEAR